MFDAFKIRKHKTIVPRDHTKSNSDALAYDTTQANTRVRVCGGVYGCRFEPGQFRLVQRSDASVCHGGRQARKMFELKKANSHAMKVAYTKALRLWQGGKK
jgi:hypothetical protein